MSLDIRTPLAIRFLTGLSTGGSNPDFVCLGKNGTVTIEEWNSIVPQPTEQEINDALADLTVVNSQTFSQWYAERGGDPVATEQRIAREQIDADDKLGRIVVAVVQGILDEVRKEVPGVADPTPAQIRTFIKNKINNI